MSDGLIEVVGVYGAWHLGQLQVGLNRAVRLAQGSRVQVMTSEELPMQVDGEPWLQAAATVTVSLKVGCVVVWCGECVFERGREKERERERERDIERERDVRTAQTHHDQCTTKYYSDTHTHTHKQ